MSLFDDLGVAAIVAEVMGDLGPEVTLSTVTQGAYDPATGVATTSTTSLTVTAVVEDFRGIELLNGLVEVGDKKVSIAGAPLAAAPTPGDTVLIDATSYTVISVQTVKPGVEAILYVLQCRRA